MRARLLAAVLLAATAATGACAPRAQPYRFAMPMLGQADVPAETLRPAAGHGPDRDPDSRTASGPNAGHNGRADAARTRYAYGWQKDAQSGIRTVSAAGIEIKQPEASNADALAVTDRGVAHEIASRGVPAARLPAPHRATSAAITAIATGVNAPAGSSSGGATPATTAVGASGANDLTGRSSGGVTSAIELPRMQTLREPAGLRALVGTRDRRDSFAIAIGWLAELGMTFVEPASTIEMATALANKPADGPALVAWAAARGKLFGPTETPVAGDVLVFDRATANREADLIAIVVGRDARGVLEIVYAGGGVIRRGFVDPSRPSTRRDLSGAVINTFLRHSKQWPPKGTRYLAGELLAHMIRVH